MGKNGNIYKIMESRCLLVYVEGCQEKFGAVRFATTYECADALDDYSFYLTVEDTNGKFNLDDCDFIVHSDNSFEKVDCLKYASFIDDDEKMRDFINMSKASFLASYSYLSEVDYELTRDDLLRRFAQ